MRVNACTGEDAYLGASAHLFYGSLHTGFVSVIKGEGDGGGGGVGERKGGHLRRSMNLSGTGLMLFCRVQTQVRCYNLHLPWDSRVLMRISRGQFSNNWISRA